MVQTLYPVVRLGQLVRATDASTGVATALKFSESQKALALLHVRADETLLAIREAMTAAMAGRDFEIIEHGANSLPGAGPARGLGAVYNYHEFAIRLDDKEAVVRSSVTLCIEPAKDVLEATGGKMPFSKVWTRFILVRVGGKRAADLNAKAMGAFEEDCERMSMAAVDAITGIYQQVLGKATGKDLKINARDNGDFAVITVGVTGGDSEDMFAQARAGQALSAQLEHGNKAAKRFVAFAIPTLKRDTKTAVKIAFKRFRDDDGCKVIRYQTPEADEGLYLASLRGNSPRFVGVARNLRDLDGEDDVIAFADAHHLSANVVSAGLITRLARQF